MGGHKVRRQKRNFLPLRAQNNCYILKKKLQKNGWWWGDGGVVMVNTGKIVKESIGNPYCWEKSN